MKKLLYQAKTDREEVWLTSYADLMSLLTCFFLLLYNTGESDPARQKKIEDGILATFAPKRVSELVVEEKSEIQRAFYIMMSLIQLENESPDEFIHKIDSIYKKEKTLESIEKFLEKESPDNLKRLKKKLSDRGKSEFIVEFVLDRPLSGQKIYGKKSSEVLSKELYDDVLAIGKSLIVHKGLVFVRVVRYRNETNFFDINSKPEFLNRQRQLKVAQILSESGLRSSVLGFAEEVQPSPADDIKSGKQQTEMDTIAIRVTLTGISGHDGA